jgi:hypothetical protein
MTTRIAPVALLFGSIHAYQVLLEVRLSGNGNDPRQLYLDHKKKNAAARYSLSPETPDGANQRPPALHLAQCDG